MTLKGILLDQPSASFLKLAEDCVDVYVEKNGKDEMTTADDHLGDKLSSEQQYHSYMSTLESLHIELYNLLQDPRFHLNDNHHENISNLLQERDVLLSNQLKSVEKQRKDQSDASRATILALESKLKKTL